MNFTEESHAAFRFFLRILYDVTLSFFYQANLTQAKYSATYVGRPIVDCMDLIHRDDILEKDIVEWRHIKSYGLCDIFDQRNGYFLHFLNDV